MTRDEAPPEVVRKFDEIVEENDLFFTDNFRYAPFDDHKEMERFEKQHAEGCCGSFEYDVKDAAGRRWLAGCNYGH